MYVVIEKLSVLNLVLTWSFDFTLDGRYKSETVDVRNAIMIVKINLRLNFDNPPLCH
jgi:hypothetical protein